MDIDEGDRLVEEFIGPLAKKTARPELLHGVGGFGALFELKPLMYKNPVLVSGTDGVGTKLLVSERSERFCFRTKLRSWCSDCRRCESP